MTTMVSAFPVTSAYPAGADVQEVFDTVTAAFLQVETAPVCKPDDAPPDAEVWTGCVTINGAFQGAIMLRCQRSFAHRIAGSIFEGDPPSDENARDVWAELTNVVGGNIKSLFSEVRSGVCYLSLPIVTTGAIALPKGRLVHELWRACGEDRVGIAIYESSRNDGAA